MTVFENVLLGVRKVMSGSSITSVDDVDQLSAVVDGDGDDRVGEFDEAQGLVEPIVYEDFADLGGDASVVAEIRDLAAAELNFRPSSAALLRAPTVAGFAALTEQAGSVRAANPAAASVDVAGTWLEEPVAIPLQTSGTALPGGARRSARSSRASGTQPEVVASPGVPHA